MAAIKKKIRAVTFLNDGKKQVTKPSLIDKPEYQALVERIYYLLRDGLRSNEIFATLSVEDDAMTETKFMDLLSYAYIFAENAMLKDRELMFQTHMSRYEDIYEKSMSMQGFYRSITLDKKNPKDISQIMTKYAQALAALKHKEELLGLHDKKVIIEFSGERALVIENDETRGNDGVPGYNMDNLSLDEKIELLSLIKEIRTIPIEGIQRVVVKKTKIEIDLISGDRRLVQEVRNVDKVETHDVTYEDMPPDVVSKFNNTEQKEPVPEVNPNFIDSRPKNMPAPKRVHELQDKLKQVDLNKLKEKLKQLKGK